MSRAFNCPHLHGLMDRPDALNISSRNAKLVKKKKMSNIDGSITHRESQIETREGANGRRTFNGRILRDATSPYHTQITRHVD